MSENNNEAAVETTTQAPEPAPQLVKEQPKPAKPQPKNITLVLTGAGSYKNLAYNLGSFKKNQPFSIAKDKADILLKTGLFKTV